MTGFSAGGAIAIAFARKYSEKTKGLILEAALSREYVAPDSVEGTMWERIYLRSSVQELLSYFMVISQKLMPISTLRSMLKIETTLDEPRMKRFLTM